MVKVAPRGPEYANMSSNTPGNCKPVQDFNVPSTIEIMKNVSLINCNDVPTDLEKKINCKVGEVTRGK